MATWDKLLREGTNLVSKAQNKGYSGKNAEAVQDLIEARKLLHQGEDSAPDKTHYTIKQAWQKWNNAAGGFKRKGHPVPEEGGGTGSASAPSPAPVAVPTPTPAPSASATGGDPATQLKEADKLIQKAQNLGFSGKNAEAVSLLTEARNLMLAAEAAKAAASQLSSVKSKWDRCADGFGRKGHVVPGSKKDAELKAKAAAVANVPTPAPAPATSNPKPAQSPASTASRPAARPAVAKAPSPAASTATKPAAASASAPASSAKLHNSVQSALRTLQTSCNNLARQFDVIQRGVQAGTPRGMEGAVRDTGRLQPKLESDVTPKFNAVQTAAATHGNSQHPDVLMAATKFQQLKDKVVLIQNTVQKLSQAAASKAGNEEKAIAEMKAFYESHNGNGVFGTCSGFSSRTKPEEVTQLLNQITAFQSKLSAFQPKLDHYKANYKNNERYYSSIVSGIANIAKTREDQAKTLCTVVAQDAARITKANFATQKAWLESNAHSARVSLSLAAKFSPAHPLLASTNKAVEAALGTLKSTLSAKIAAEKKAIADQEAAMKKAAEEEAAREVAMKEQQAAFAEKQKKARAEFAEKKKSWGAIIFPSDTGSAVTSLDPAKEHELPLGGGLYGFCNLQNPTGAGTVTLAIAGKTFSSNFTCPPPEEILDFLVVDFVPDRVHLAHGGYRTSVTPREIIAGLLTVSASGKAELSVKVGAQTAKGAVTLSFSPEGAAKLKEVQAQVAFYEKIGGDPEAYYLKREPILEAARAKYQQEIFQKLGGGRALNCGRCSELNRACYDCFHVYCHKCEHAKAINVCVKCGGENAKQAPSTARDIVAPAFESKLDKYLSAGDKEVLANCRQIRSYKA